ncbi:MAG TPA: UDP binding domain-containing protein, partial [Sphingomicrobium sp.]
RELTDYGIEPLVHDARADPAAIRREYGVELNDLDRFTDLDALIYAVGHDEYRSLQHRLSDFVSQGGIIADVRSLIDPASLREDIVYWSL